MDDGWNRVFQRYIFWGEGFPREKVISGEEKRVWKGSWGEQKKGTEFFFKINKNLKS